MRMIVTPWHFWVQEVPCNQELMVKTQLKLVRLVETKTNYLREGNPHLMKCATKTDQFHHRLNSWRALEVVVGRRARTRMKRSPYLRWTQSACHAPGN
jgi:hypothetical protein